MKKEAIAHTFLEIRVQCPYCSNYQDVTDELLGDLGDDLRADNLEKEITCDNDACQHKFIVNRVDF